MLEILIVAVLIFWIAGFALGIAGALIHLLLVVALVLLVIRLMRGSPSP